MFMRSVIMKFNLLLCVLSTTWYYAWATVYFFPTHSNPRYAKNGARNDEVSIFQNPTRPESSAESKAPLGFMKEKCKMLLKLITSRVEALKSDSNLWIDDIWKNKATQYVMDNLQKIVRCIKQLNGYEMILY